MIKITIENTDTNMTIDRVYTEAVVSEDKLGKLTNEMIELVSPVIEGEVPF